MNGAMSSPKNVMRARDALIARLTNGGAVGGMTDEQVIDFHSALLASGRDKPPVS